MADNDIQGSDVHGNEIQGDGSPAGVAGDDRPVIRIGTRGSELATTQAGHVRDALIRMGHEAELVIVKTEGDANRHDPVEKIGIGVFTQALRHARNTCQRHPEVAFNIHTKRLQRRDVQHLHPSVGGASSL